MRGFRPAPSACTRLGSWFLVAAVSSVGAGGIEASPTQDVHVVDAAGGGDFVRIVDAVAVAAAGDVLLVKDGAYPNEGDILLGSGSITIVAEAGAAPDVTAKFCVSGLPAGAQVTLRGLAVQNGALSLCLEAENNSGTLWLEDCSFSGFPASLFDAPDPVVLTDCARVIARTCTMTGGTGVGGLSGGSGIVSVRSGLFLEGCTLTGGGGAQLPTTLAGDVGGAGLTQEDGTLVVADGVLRGGQGGDGGVFGTCADSGDGGVGLHLTGTNPSATLRGVLLEGGEPGVLMGVGSCVEGQPGDPSDVEAGALQEFAWPLRTFTVDSPVRTDELAQATFGATPGESVWIGLSTTPASSFLSPLNGSLFLSTPIQVVFVGVVDGSGTIQYSTMPGLAPGFEGDVVYGQALFFDPLASAFTLGPGSAIAVLDPAF